VRQDIFIFHRLSISLHFIK
jgi:hypothetical protein